MKILSIASLLVSLGAAPADDAIRPHDRIYLTNGRELVGIIQSPDNELVDPVEIRTVQGAVIKIPRASIDRILARQTAEQVYAKKLKRVRSFREPAQRSETEFQLALWCKTPLAVLDGAAPKADAAFQHLINAVTVNPSLHAAYPHILAALAEKGEPTQLSEPEVEAEVRLSLLAREGNYENPELDFRLGTVLAHQLDDPVLAVTYLENVVGSNHENKGQLRQARSLLANLYRRLGTPEKAFGLYESIVVSPDEDPANFEAFFELGKLHMQSGVAAFGRAREFLAKAQVIQPDFIEILGYLAAMEYHEGNLPGAEKHLKSILLKDRENFSATLDLALIHVRRGLFNLAEKKLPLLLSQAEPLEKARIHCALGTIAEARGNGDIAVGEYRNALVADPGSVEAKIALGFLLARSGQYAEARQLAQSMIQSHRENLKVFAACSRLLGEVELGEGRMEDALSHFQRAVEIDSSHTQHLEQTGILYLKAGKLDAGYELLRRLEQKGIQDRPDTANALAYYYYMRGDRLTAEKIFKQVTSRSVRDPRASRGTPQQLYARNGLDLIADLEGLEVWTADFTGPDGPTLNGWNETERYGIEISRQNETIVFSGTQGQDAQGVTLITLQRPVEVRSFDRISMSGRVVSGDVRLALRLEGRSRTGASAGLVFYRDFDGTLKFQTKSTRGDWQIGEPTTEQDAARGKLVYPGTVVWPSDDRSHLLEIRRAQESRSRLGSSSRSSNPLLRRRRTYGGNRFNLLLDGAMVAQNVDVGGLSGLTYEAGISGQTDELGKNYRMMIDGFKVYRTRPRTETRTRR